MMKSLFAVIRIDPGFRPDHLLTMKFSLPESRYKNNEQIAAVLSAGAGSSFRTAQCEKRQLLRWAAADANSNDAVCGR